MVYFAPKHHQNNVDMSTENHLENQVNDFLKNKKVEDKNIIKKYLHPDQSFALIAFNTKQDLNDNASSILFILLKDNLKESGALIQSHFQGEDFYFYESEIINIDDPVQQADPKSFTCNVKFGREKNRIINFDLK